MTDISSFMSSFLSSFISTLSIIFGYLSNIQFLGISLLSFTVALFVLSVAIPIVISIVSGGYSSSKGFFYSEHLHARRVAEAEERYEGYMKKRKNRYRKRGG